MLLMSLFLLLTHQVSGQETELPTECSGDGCDSSWVPFENMQSGLLGYHLLLGKYTMMFEQYLNILSFETVAKIFMLQCF